MFKSIFIIRSKQIKFLEKIIQKELYWISFVQYIISVSQTMHWFPWIDCLPSYAFRYWHIIRKNSFACQLQGGDGKVFLHLWMHEKLLWLHFICTIYALCTFFLSFLSSRFSHNPYRYILIHFSYKPFLSEFGYVT